MTQPTISANTCHDCLPCFLAWLNHWWSQRTRVDPRCTECAWYINDTILDIIIFPIKLLFFFGGGIQSISFSDTPKDTIYQSMWGCKESSTDLSQCMDCTSQVSCRVQHRVTSKKVIWNLMIIKLSPWFGNFPWSNPTLRFNLPFPRQGTSWGVGSAVQDSFLTASSSSSSCVASRRNAAVSVLRSLDHPLLQHEDGEVSRLLWHDGRGRTSTAHISRPWSHGALENTLMEPWVNFWMFFLLVCLKMGHLPLSSRKKWR